jgi:exodeoxyribonuclease VIII
MKIHQLLAKHHPIEWSDKFHRLNERGRMRYKANDDPLFSEQTDHHKGVLYDMPNDLYHAERGHVSSSGLKIFDDNPYEFKSIYVDNAKSELQEDDQYLTLGSLVHCILLEPENLDELYVVAPDEGPDGEPINRRKKNHRAWLESFAIKNRGKTVITDEQLRDGFALASSVDLNPLAKGLLTSENALREVSLFCREPTTSVKVKCKLDTLVDYEDRPTILDLKTTTSSSSPDGFATTCSRFKYDVSAALYSLIFKAVTGVMPRFIFAVIEKNDNGFHQCVLHELDEDSLQLGIDEVRRVLQDLTLCHFDEFKSPYVNKVNVITSPGWRFKNRRKNAE